MSGRVFLILVALLATGFIFLPQMVTLFAGQHYWYDLEEEETLLSSDIDCEKCHADIADEMALHKGPHTGETGFDRMECVQCHRVKLGTYQFAGVWNSTVVPGKYAHAASTVACMDCHGYINQHEFDNYTVGGNHRKYEKGDNPYWFGPQPENCQKCHGQGDGNKFSPIPAAGGFGLTNGTGDTGSSAAHMSFITNSVNSSILKDENEACIGCHTAAAVKINWSHARSLEFEVGLDDPVTTDTGVHNWTFTTWTSNGTANATVFGNTTGSGTTDGQNWPGNVGNIYT